MSCDRKDVRLHVLYDEPVSSVVDAALDDEDITTGTYVEVPTIDEGVETHVRKEGAASITCLSNAHFPVEWKGEDYAQYIRALDDVQQSQIARIQYRRPADVDEDDWVTVHTGYVRQAGSASNGRKMRLQIGDFSDFMAKVPASKSFNQPSIDDVLGYVTDTLDEYVTIVDDVTYTDLSEVGDATLTHMGQSFTSNRDTLVDVMNWFTDTVDAYWWFTGNDDGSMHLNFSIDPLWQEDIATIDEGNAYLVADDSDYAKANIAAQSEITSVKETVFTPGEFTEANLFADRNDVSYDVASDERTNVVVLENQALSQLSPINSVTVYGDSPTSLNTPAGDIKLKFWRSIPSQKYPAVTATYDPLHERANATLAPPIIEADTSTVTATERRAKQELIDRLNESQGGEMTLLGNPMVTPFDVIEARPACHGRTDVSVRAMSYEVQSLTHTCPAGERFQTNVEVGLHVDPTAISTDDELRDE